MSSNILYTDRRVVAAALSLCMLLFCGDSVKCCARLLPYPGDSPWQKRRWTNCPPPSACATHLGGWTMADSDLSHKDFKCICFLVLGGSQLASEIPADLHHQNRP